MIVHPVDALPPVRHTLVVWKTGGDGLHALSLGGYQSRHQSVLTLLDRAEQDHGGPPFGPLVIHTGDRPISPATGGWRSYAFSTAPGYGDVAVPDFVFGGWPEVGIDDFDETAEGVAAAGRQRAERPVVGWIGSCHTHPVRWVLRRLGEEHPDLLEVDHVDWVPGPSQDRLRTSKGNHLTLPEQVGRWSALLDVEGMGYSGRLKLLLHSGRPVLVQERPWQEWYWGALVPMEHYIPVRSDLSDLVEAARWVQEHPQEAEEIGRAGQRLARRMLTRTCAVERWARTLSAAAQTETDPETDRWAPETLGDPLSRVLRPLGAPI